MVFEETGYALAVTVLGSGMAFLDGTVVDIVLPDIGRDWSAAHFVS